jgi:hypothetical protein
MTLWLQFMYCTDMQESVLHSTELHISGLTWSLIWRESCLNTCINTTASLYHLICNKPLTKCMPACYHHQCSLHMSHKYPHGMNVERSGLGPIHSLCRSMHQGPLDHICSNQLHIPAYEACHQPCLDPFNIIIENIHKNCIRNVSFQFDQPIHLN